MLGGFNPLRNECPMNMARKPGAIEVSDGVRSDVARIEQIWSECLENSGGPFLFGEFCNADAMYAPVVNRMEKYLLSDSIAAVEGLFRGNKGAAGLAGMGGGRPGGTVDLSRKTRPDRAGVQIWHGRGGLKDFGNTHR